MKSRAQGTFAVAILAVSFCAYWFDESLPGKLAPAIASAFHQPLPVMGLLFTLTRLALGIGALTGGVLGDRRGHRSVLCAGLFLAALTAAVTPLANQWAEFLLLRTLSALCLGATAPCALALAARQLSPQRKAIAIGVTLAGAGVGSVLASGWVYWMPDISHWQSGFYASATALALSASLCAVIRRNQNATSRVNLHAAQQLLHAPLWTLTVGLGVASCLSMGLNALLTSWLPSYFSVFAGVGIQRFAAISVYAAPASILGMLSAGWITRRGSLTGVLCLTCLVQAVTLAALGTLPFASAGFVVAFCVENFSQAACQALLSLAAVTFFPEAIRASALGALTAAGRMGGIVAPIMGAMAFAASPPLQSLFAWLAMIPLGLGAALWLALKSAPGPKPLASNQANWPASPLDLRYCSPCPISSESDIG